MLPPPMNTTFTSRSPSRHRRARTRGPAPEDGAADADNGGAFRDGRFEVVRHAHRQGIHVEPLATAGIETLATDAELGAQPLDVLRRLGNSHESPQAQIG